MPEARRHTAVVDGYNVTQRSAQWRRLPIATARRQLSAYLQHFRWPVPIKETILVFDAGQSQDLWPVQQITEHFWVRFASPSADAYIQQLIRTSSKPQFLLIVTDDGEILQTARQHGAACLSTQELLAKHFGKPKPSSQGVSEEKEKHTLSSKDLRTITEELTQRWLRKKTTR